MNNFIYNIPTKVYFGENQLSHLSEELKRFGSRVLMTYGGGSIKKMGLYDKLFSLLGPYVTFALPMSVFILTAFIMCNIM